MITDYIPSEVNPFVSRTGRTAYSMLFRKRQERINLAEIVGSSAESELRCDGAEPRPDAAPAEAAPRAEGTATDNPPADREPDSQQGNIIRFPASRAEFAGQDVSLGDLLDWFRHKEQDAVRGQEKALIKMTLKAIMLDSFTVEGPAGRGKTYLLKALASALPDNIAYWFEFGTDAALFNNYQEINRHKIIVLPEYQKMLQGSPRIKEIVKTITEGRTASRKKMGDGEDVVEQCITPKCVITAIADENEHRESANSDKESMRRFSHIRLDTSLDATREVREYKRQKRSTLPEYRKTAPESLGRRIRQHLADCISLKLENPPFDPFAEFMDQYLPMTDKSIAYIDDYYSYLDGCAKFHYKKRMLESGRQENIVLDLADHYIIHQIYHAEFCQTLLKLDNLGEFGERAQKAMEPVDWRACFGAGIAKMRENLPEVVAEKWVKRQLTDGKLLVPGVARQEEVKLFDYE